MDIKNIFVAIFFSQILFSCKLDEMRWGEFGKLAIAGDARKLVSTIKANNPTKRII
jgi:hypothetical protein